MCAVTLVWRTVLVLLLHSPSDRTYLATDTRFDSMLFGCCLAVFGNPALDLPERERPTPVELLWLAGGVCLLLSSFAVRDPSFRETLRYTLQGLGLFPVFVTAVRYPNWGPYPLLQIRFVRYVGTISFTLYLVHQVVILVLNDHGIYYRPVVFPVALAVSLGFASAMWFVIEKPCAGLRRRFASTGPRAASTQDSAGGIEPAPIRARADVGPS
jgi:peptidoglycan/LPS O-acetylase OafA/YrhL